MNEVEGKAVPCAYIIKHYAMKVYEGVEIWTHSTVGIVTRMTEALEF
jgi:hypothetical protein